LASKCGFIRVIFFHTNAARLAKRNRKLPCHLRLANVERLVSVVVNVVRRVVAVHKESVNREVSVLHVQRGSDPKGRRESVLQEASVLKENEHRVVRSLHVHHVRRESVLLELGVPNVRLKRCQHQPSQRRRQLLNLKGQHQPFQRYRQSPRFRIFRAPREQRRRHHPHQHQARVLLRASRGDSKPCYWHRHDISTASSIAVA